MPNTSQNYSILRFAMLLDAVGSAAMGLMLAVATVPLASLFGLPEMLLRVCGLGLLPYAAILATAGMRANVSTSFTRLVIAGNLAWVALSGVLPASGMVAPTALGYGFVIVQAIAVLAFAELQFIGLRRERQPRPALA